MHGNNGKIKVMFVCLGNICRSPMAEMVFANLVKEKGLSALFEVQSSGTGAWHEGERPHPGTIQILREKNVPVDPRKRAQQIKSNVFQNFDYIVAMDSSNKQNLKRLGNATLLLDEIPGGKYKDVPDPYYEQNFDFVYELVTEGCTYLLKRICEEKELAC
jgi:protein-tyrosine phosphatase